MGYSTVWKAKRAIAIPLTFLMLFVSLTALISVTYYFAVTQINVSSQAVKVSAAKQRMTSLENTVQSVLWSPGAYETFEFDDFGGTFKTEPSARSLVMNLTDGSFYDVFFNSSVGRIAYELPASYDDYVFLKGDKRAVVNQTSSTMTQLYIAVGSTSPEITLSYRPLAGSMVTEQSGAKPTNSMRVYVVNLNSSQTLAVEGKFRLKATCLNVTSTWQNYDFSNPLTSLTLKVTLGTTTGTVTLPIVSNANGAYVSLETVVCNVRIENVGEL